MRPRWPWTSLRHGISILAFRDLLATDVAYSCTWWYLDNIQTRFKHLNSAQRLLDLMWRFTKWHGMTCQPGQMARCAVLCPWEPWGKDTWMTHSGWKMNSGQNGTPWLWDWIKMNRISIKNVIVKRYSNYIHIIIYHIMVNMLYLIVIMIPLWNPSI